MKAPLHLWIVAGISLLWACVGGYDYTMTQMKNQRYLALLSEARRGFLEAAPVWFDAAWAVCVWFAILASLLLLTRARLARPAFGIALLGLMGAVAYCFALAEPSVFAVTGPYAFGIAAVMFAILFVLWRYAAAMTRRGVLR